MLIGEVTVAVFLIWYLNTHEAKVFFKLKGPTGSVSAD